MATDKLEAANNRIKVKRAAVDKEIAEMGLESVLAKHILGKKCHYCGFNFQGKASSYCNQCRARLDRIKILKERPAKFAEDILKLVGGAYINAELTDLDDALYEKLEQCHGDLFLWGDIGVGKTYAMAALLKHYVGEGFECDRTNFDGFCSLIRSSMNNNSRITEDALVKHMTGVDKLFIDDLGMRSKQETDFAYITLYRILNTRQERLLPTLITTNRSIDELNESFDTRIASRLSTMLNIHMTGQDRRESK
jgi:DNA replication protein DnaC